MTYIAKRREIRSLGSKGFGLAALLCPVATYMNGVIFPVQDPIFPIWFWAIIAAAVVWPIAWAFLAHDMFSSVGNENE